ncbi:hypothetical protein ZWY2020_002093 [Hordeum vulgare]|nr:hypothetical protein ZWY2020_002093 [Hordeum vulgare]
MSSQDSEGESYVADYLANPKVYGDLEPYGWTTDEEEDYHPKGKEQMSSYEEEPPLPQPGRTHVEFKKLSLPHSRKKPKNLFIPSCFLQESKKELCQRVLKLEEENDDLREQNFMLKWKLDKLKTSATTPPPSSPPKEDN